MNDLSSPANVLDQSVDYGVAKASDAEEIVRLLAAVFSASEPPAVAMGLSSGDLEQFLRLFAPAAIADELTIIARSRESGKLAGVLLTDDFAGSSTLDLNRISTKFLPIFSMLETLDEQYRTGKTISTGQYLHLFMLAVDAQFTGRGIAQRMVKECLENGLRKNYRMALTEATGRVSQSVFHKLGFGDRFSVSYRHFKYEGRFVFASIEGHDRAILMDRSLE